VVAIPTGTCSSADEVSAELPGCSRSITVFPSSGGRFGRPQVSLRLLDRAEDARGLGVMVDDAQRPPVRGPCAAVPADLRADLLGAAEMLGQQVHTGAGHECFHRPSPGSTSCHPARVSSASYTAARDSPVTVTRSKLRCAPFDCSRAS